jgi:anion-transporting  ArsA/GET3 family ATPase
VLKLDAFAERLLDFAKSLRELDLRLSDPERSAAIVVTQAGPLVTAETERLVARLRENRIRVGALLLNRADEASAMPTPPDAVPLILAPLVKESPIGPQALREFAASWRIHA